MLDAVERKGDFAATAHELGKAPLALTYVVRGLEDDLDVLSFDRRRHCAELTPAGRALLNEGCHLLQAVDDLTRHVKRLVTGQETMLTIVINDLMYLCTFIPVIQGFCAEGTAMRLCFYREALADMWDALLSGCADLLIGPTRVMQIQGIQTRTASNIPFVFAVAVHHPLAQMGGSLFTAAITRYHIVAVGDTSHNLPTCTIGMITGQNTLVVPSMTDKVQTQIRGLGCGWSPALLARPYLDSGVSIAKGATGGKRAATFQVA